MIEKEPSSEGQTETHTKEEVLGLLGIEGEKMEVRREDIENGRLLRLEVALENGDEYEYMCSGNIEGSHKSEEAFIVKTTATSWPEKILVFENGEWKRV